ncbi:MULTISPECIES: hypothetical protein [Rothia]|uniref:hypothetical protein n=1 Tax=Rothia TaxID=32207 RepID=UPI00117B06F6|nr:MULTISPECIES: hypothetical protein [Rothia]
MKLASISKGIALAIIASTTFSGAAFADTNSHISASMDSSSLSTIISSQQARIYISHHPNIEVADPGFFEADTVAITGIQDLPLGDSLSTSALQSARCPLLRAGFIYSHQWTESTNGCGIIGASRNANYRYGWTKDRYFLNVAPDACVQGRGYSYNLSVQEPIWVNAGCGANGEAVVTIGNRATVAKIRGKTMGSVPSSVYWR